MNIAQLTIEMAANVARLRQDMDGAVTTVNGAVAKIQRAAEMAGKALAGIGAGLGIAEIVRMADAVTELNNRLRLSTGSTAAAADAYRELYQIAQRSRVSFTELGNTFATISRAGSELGVSQQRLLKVTEAIGNAMTISGGSAESMKAALVQLGQGLASGTLRGEELNSVMEQTPRLAQALADGFGVSIGALRKMGEEGEITAEKVIQALEGQAEVLSGEVSSSVMTVGQAFTQLQNAAVKTVGDMDEVTGASGTLAEALSGVATGIQTVGQVMRENEEAITITLGALGGAAVASGILSVASAITGAGGMVAAIASVKAAMVGLTAFMASNPVGLAVLGIATVGGAVMAMNKGPDLSKTEVQARELERTVKRLADAEALLARAGGAGQGQMTAQIEARIAGLKKYRDELSAGQTQDKAITEAMRADEKQWTAEQKKATAEAEASSKRLTDIKNELYKVDTKYIGKLQELAAQRNAGNISEAEYVKLVKMAVDANASKEKSSTKLSAAAKAQAEIEKEAAKGLELYSNLIAETAGFQGDYPEKVSQLAEAYAANKISLEGLTFAHEKLLAKQPAAVEATKAEAEARKVLADAVIASARAYEEAQQAMDALQADTWQMVNDTVKASKDSAAAVQFELGLIGQTTEARRIAIEQRKIELDLEEKIKKVKVTPFEGGEEAQLREINRLREAAAQDSATAISRIQLDEAAKSVEQYDKIFREGFAALIAGGKDSWKSFTKSLTTTFKTAVVDQIYKAFMQPFVVNVVANMVGIAGLGGTQGAVAGAGNLLSLAGNAGSIYNVGSSVAGWLGLGGTAAATGLGLTAAAGAGTTLAATSAGLGLTGSALGAGYGLSAAGTGLGISAGSAGASAIGAGIGTSAAASGTAAAASTASSLMSTVATAMPYLAAATALITIAKSFDDSGTLHMGAGAIYQQGRLREGRDIYGQELFKMGAPAEYNANAQANVSGIASAIGNALDTVATSFGKKAGYEIATAFADDSSGDGAWGALRISQGGQDLINWQDTRTSRWAPKEFADGEEGYKQYLAAVAKDTRQALLDMDLPGWAKTVFSELGDSPSIETLAKSLEQVGRFNGVLEAMGENVLPALADASDSAITALVKAAGGTDALTASMVNYYNSTATDLDRQQYAFKTLNTALKEVGDLRPQAINLSDSLSGMFSGLGSKFANAVKNGLLLSDRALQGGLPELEQLTLPEGDVNLREWHEGLVEAASALDLNVQGNADYLAGLMALRPAVDALAEAWDASLEGIFGSTTLGALANAALRGDAFATAVINAAGGLEAFGEAITGYYDNFYTEGERAAMTTAQIEKELAKVGETMPKTREEFRALMDEHVAMGEAGQPVVNALLKVQGAFASVTEPIAEAAAAVETVEQAYTRLTTATRTAEDVANERISLEERLFSATATTAQAAEKARNAIDPLNRSLYDTVIAAEAKKVADERIANEKLSLEERLFNATANAAQIAEKARNAIDPMNQALYDTVLAAERLKEATETVPDALESSLGRAPAQEELDYWIGQVSSGVMTLQDALKGIAEDGVTEKLTLRIKELEGAEGYLTEVRDRELSLLSPTNQALQKRIWALEDEKKATEEAAAKAKTIADQLLGLEGRLLTLQGNTAELRRRELALLDPSNQALQQRIWALEDLKAAEDAYNTALSERDNAQSAVDRVLGEATNAYLNAVQQQASAAQRVADLHRQAAEKMLSVGKSLREFVSGEMVSGADQVTSQRLAQSDFSALLGRANAGDTEAYGQLSDAARTLLDKSREVMGQGEFDRVRASVLRSLQSAADAADAAAAASSAKAGAAQPDPMTEALSALQSADTALAEALRVATTIGAPLVETQRDLIAEYQKAKDTLVQAEDKLAKALDALNDIKKNTGDTVKAIGELKIKLGAIDLGASATIDFILGSDLPADLKELALGGPRTVQATVDYLLGNLDSIPKPLMDVVLGTLTQFDVTTNFLVGSALPDDLKRLALTASDRVIQNTYDFLTGTALPTDLKQLAVLNSGAISRTINFVAGSAELTDAQKKVAFDTLGDYTTTVKAVLDSTMSASIKKVVLDGAGVYEASVEAAAASDLPASLKKVLFDGAGDYLTTIKSTLDSSLTDDQKTLLLNANSSAQRIIDMSVTGGTLNADQKAFLSTAAGTISRALALTASGGSLTAEQSNFLGYAAATVSRVLSLSASGGSLTADQQAILKAVGGTTSSSVTANVSGTVTWNPSSGMETIFNAIKEGTGWLDEIHGYIGVVASSVGGGGGWLKEIYGYLGLIYTRMGDGTQKVKSVSTTGTQTNFWSGGYTGPGGMYEPAGIVHKGEVVWSQTDIARAGGVAVVEAMRKGLRGYADGGAVATTAYTPPTYTPPIAVRQGGSDTTALERRMDAVVQELREARRESARQIRILEQQLMEQTRMASDVRGVRNNGLQVYTDPAEPLDTKLTEVVPA